MDPQPCQSLLCWDLAEENFPAYSSYSANRQQLERLSAFYLPFKN
jgi:hypothetical protein